MTASRFAVILTVPGGSFLKPMRPYWDSLTRTLSERRLGAVRLSGRFRNFLNIRISLTQNAYTRLKYIYNICTNQIIFKICLLKMTVELFETFLLC